MKLYDLPILAEGNFVDLCIDILKQQKPGITYHEFGKNGQNQGGIDIISYEDKSVIQCKWKAINQSDLVKRKQLIEDINKDIRKVRRDVDFNYSNVIFISTHYNDVHVQKHVKKLSEKMKINIEYWGWATVQKLIQDSEYLMKKYYSKFRRIRELTSEMANHLSNHHFEAHRGAILLCPEKTAIFGNDGYGSGKSPTTDGEKRTRTEVKRMRLRLKKLGIEEVSFELCDESYTWVLVVDSADARMLHAEIWKCYPTGGSNNELQQTKAFEKLWSHWDWPFYENCV